MAVQGSSPPFTNEGMWFGVKDILIPSTTDFEAILGSISYERTAENPSEFSPMEWC